MAGALLTDVYELNMGGLHERRATPATPPGETEVLDLVARGAKRDESHLALDQPAVVVVPYFVAFDWVAPTATAADLAAVSGGERRHPAQAVPDGRSDVVRT